MQDSKTVVSYKSYSNHNMSGIKHCESYSVKNSMMSDSQVVPMSPEDSDFAFTSQKSPEVFKVKEEMAGELRKMNDQNQQLQAQIRMLMISKEELELKLKTNSKENQSSQSCQPVNGFKKAKKQVPQNQPQTKTNQQRSQLQNKIGCLNLQLQRERRQRQMMMQSFNQDHDQMVKELTVLRDNSTLKDKQLKQLDQKLDQVCRKVLQRQEELTTANKIVQDQKTQILELKALIVKYQAEVSNNESSRKTSIVDKLYGSKKVKEEDQQQQQQHQPSVPINTSYNLIIDSVLDYENPQHTFIKSIILQLHQRNYKVMQENKALTEELKSSIKEGAQVKNRLKLLEENNNLLKGKVLSYETMIDRQQGDIGKLIKSQEIEVEALTSIESRRMERKYSVFKLENQNLKNSLEEVRKQAEQKQAKFMGNIMELQKALVSKVIPGTTIQGGGDISLELLSNLEKELERYQHLYFNQRAKNDQLIAKNQNLRMEMERLQQNNRPTFSQINERSSAMGKIVKQKSRSVSQAQDYVKIPYISQVEHMIHLKKVTSNCENVPFSSHTNSNRSSAIEQSMGRSSISPMSPITTITTPMNYPQKEPVMKFNQMRSGLGISFSK